MLQNFSFVDNDQSFLSLRIFISNYFPPSLNLSYPFTNSRIRQKCRKTTTLSAFPIATVLISLTALVGVAFSALVFCLCHCYRKRKAAKAIEAQDVKRAATLQLWKRGGLMTENHHTVQ